MTLLITGAGGQIGRELCLLARERNLPIRGLSRAELDITDAAAVDRAIRGAGLVINAAAYTAVDRAESERDAAFSVNRDGAAKLAAACAAAGIPLLQISTDYVFDGRKAAPYREDDPVHPLSVYGASKAEGERAIRERFPRHIILRTAWVFSSHGENFVLAIRKAAAQKRVLNVVSDQRGGPTAAADVAAALLSIAAAVQERGFDRWGTYHFCGTPAVTRHEFALAILRDRPDVTVRAVSSDVHKTPAVRPANSELDCTRIGEVFGIKQPSWKTTLAALRPSP